MKTSELIEKLEATARDIDADAYDECWEVKETEKGKFLRLAAARLREQEEALLWIEKIADVNYEQDENLRSQGARTLARISDRARKTLGGEA